MEKVAEGAGVVHHFCDGVYMKETFIENGYTFAQHEHPFDHLSVLAKGVARVVVDGKATIYHAPKVLLIEAGKVHSVSALTDIVWICAHRDNETDPTKIDDSILTGMNRA